MKKIIVGLLCGMLAIGTFAGCGGSKDSTKEADTVDYTEFEWPRGDIAQIIPQPKSNIGHVEWESSTGVCMYVAEMTQDDYADYVNECWDAGFNVDYDKGDEYFHAHNADGYDLDLDYEGNDVIFIRVDAPDDGGNEVDSSAVEEISPEDQTDETTAETQSTDSHEATKSINAQSTDSPGIRPEVKEFLDSYESFMNEYADFMEKYQDSDDVASMMKDYATYMTKYADFTQKYDDMGNDDLNDEELKYYIDVQSRVSKRLIDVAN